MFFSLQDALSVICNILASLGTEEQFLSVPILTPTLRNVGCLSELNYAETVYNRSYLTFEYKKFEIRELQFLIL